MKSLRSNVLKFIFLTAFVLFGSNLFAQNGGTVIEINEKGEPVGAKSGGEVKPASAPTMNLLRAIEAKHGSATTVKGSFEQVKESEVFLETIKSVGTFSFQKPDLFRIDYRTLDASGKPQEETVNLIVKDAIYNYTPSIKQVERYKFHSPEERDQQLHVMVLGLGFKAETVAKEYEVRSSEDDPELVAELKKDGQAPDQVALIEAVPVASLMDTSPFTRIKLWVDKTAMIPQKIWFEDFNGDKTTISNLGVKFSEPLAASLFEAKFPAGTAMIDKSE